jgi:hypothetical protein
MRKPITLAVMAALAGTGALLAPAGNPLAATAGIKAVAPKGTFDASDLLADYGRTALYRVDGAALAQAGSAAHAEPDADQLLFSAHPFNTQRDRLSAPAPFTLDVPPGPGLQVVQFVGPIKQAWLDTLAANGIKPVHYVANNGYLVWADQPAQAQLANLRTTAAWLQYASPYYGFLKVGPHLGERLGANPASHDEVDVTVQIYRHDGDGPTRQFVTGHALLPQSQRAPAGPGKIDAHWTPVLAFANVNIRVHLADIPAIAARPDVVFVGEKLPNKMMDEKQDLILTGDLNPGPASVDYVQYLIDLGFSQDPDAYPIVDLTDSTIDEGGSGVTVLDTADPRLHVAGDINQPVRVAYFHNCSTTPDAQVGAIDGHGSLNAGIIIGYDQTPGTPYQDADGLQLGLGVNPFGRVGSTAIFVPGYDVNGCGGTDQGVIQANWDNGAKISSNSWGATFPPSTYDASDQAYDVGVRDADATSDGNQQMIYVFAAANAGPSAATVSSPGAGKNVITVGASENVRPDWTDGCATGPSGADDAMDVIGFSSRGPAPGQRTKPEVIGPGTHIQSGASNYSGYTGGGVCDQYHPLGQTIFAASSGTSHSTPATSAMAQLSYWWIEQGGAGAAAGTIDELDGPRAPSPALMKAWLMAHPTYLTGVSANDDLPSNSQGYGMPNMSLMFDATPKVLLDQSEVFDNTGDNYQITVGIADPGKPVRIALAYTDQPGTLGTSPQVNNLDLGVENGGNTYLGNQFDHQWSVTGGSADTRNNYEAVFLPAGSSGDVTISVDAFNIAGDGVPDAGDATDQDFALVCYNCSRNPTFTLGSPTRDAEVCAGTDFSAPITVNQITGFTDPVDLVASGNPPPSSASVTPTTVTPPGSAELDVTGSDGVAAGDYTITVTGTSGAVTKTLDFDLTYFSGVPLATTLATPADGAQNVPAATTFTWVAQAQVGTYLLEVATDPGFTDIVVSQQVPGSATTYTASALDTNTQYYWRVSDANICGDGAASAVFSFTTIAAPGDCAIGTDAVTLFEDDVESGDNGWSHAAAVGGDTWTINTARPNSPSNAWFVQDPGELSDQTLTSPVIDLPDTLGALTFQFQNWRDIENSGSDACWDGGILEVALDGGAFEQVPGAQLLTDPYTGDISTQYSNPLGGEQGWCGSQPYTNSIVDASPYAGHSAQFRFRLGSDSSLGHEGWYIDDIKVKGCDDGSAPDDVIFENGFE